MADEDSKSTRVTLFDGRDQNFPFWEQKSIARAYKKQFHGILMGTIVVPKFGTDYDKSSPPDDKMQAHIDENLVAYCDLINSMDMTLSGGQMAFQLVTKTVTKVFPNGNAHRA
jgi:hypothetical protein